MASNVAISLSVRKMPYFMDEVINFCVQYHTVSTLSARIYICSFIGLLFHTRNCFITQKKMSCDQDLLGDHLIPQFTILCDILLERHADMSTQVRVEVINAISSIQRETAPRSSSSHIEQLEKLLISHLCDVSKDCRIAAIRCVQSTSVDVIDLLTDIAFGDSDEDVRYAAVHKLSKFNANIFSGNQRMAILKSAFNRGEKKGGKKYQNILIDSWIDMLFKAENHETNRVVELNPHELLLTNILNWLEPYFCENETENLRMMEEIVFHALNHCRMKEFLIDSEVFCFLKMISSCNKLIILNQENYEKIFEDCICAMDRAKAVFLWYCVLFYCKTKATSVGDWSECMHLLLPTLRVFCEFLQRQIKAILKSENDNDLHTFFIYQLIRILSLYESNDIAGRQAWLNLIENTLTDEELQLPCGIVNCIVQQLFNHIWPSRIKNYEVLTFVCDVLNCVLNKSLKSNVTCCETKRDNETMDFHSNLEQIGNSSLLRCIMILSATVKTNRFTTINTLLRSLYDNIVDKCLVNSNVECRRLAFETAGIMGLHDSRIAFEITQMIKVCLAMEEHLRVTLLEILCNFSLAYGYAKVDEWFQQCTESDNANIHNIDIISIFEKYMNSQDANESCAACLSVCKLLMHEVDVGWTKQLVHIVLKAFDPAITHIHKLKMSLMLFVPAFAAVSRKHQIMLMRSFGEVFCTLRSRNIPEESFEAYSSSIAMSFFRASTLKTESKECKKPENAQFVLCEEIVNIILENPDDCLTDICCRRMSNMNISDWDDYDSLHDLADDLVKILKLLRNEEDDDSDALKEFEKFYQNIRNRLKDWKENFEMVNDGVLESVGSVSSKEKEELKLPSCCSRSALKKNNSKRRKLCENNIASTKQLLNLQDIHAVLAKENVVATSNGNEEENVNQRRVLSRKAKTKAVEMLQTNFK